MKIASRTFPLTLSQSDIYFDQLRHPNCPLYNIGGYIACGKIEVEKMRAAHAEVVRLNDAFGIRIVNDGADIQQQIAEERDTGLPLIDFSDAQNPATQADLWLKTLFETPVPFENVQLFKAFLLKLGPTEFRYVGFSHHLAMDGWGFLNWAKQLGCKYNDLTADASRASCWRQVSSGDQEYLRSRRYAQDKQHWLEQCQPLPARLLPPYHSTRYDNGSSIPSGRYTLHISRERFRQLESFAQELAVGVPQVFLTIMALYFCGAYERSHLSIGIQTHNRRGASQKETIGVFTNVSPLIASLDDTNSFFDLVENISNRYKSNFKRQRFPVGHLIKELKLAGRGQSLYDVIFNYLKQDYNDLAFGEDKAGVVYLSHGYDQTPLTVTVWDGVTNDIEVHFDYNLAYFESREISDIASRFDNLLHIVPKSGRRPLREIDILPEAEHRHQFVLGTGSIDQYSEACLHQLFERQVIDNPNEVAVVFGDQKLTYRTLNGRADELAQHLLACGVGSAVPVGICVKRSPAMLVGLLAIMKAGAAYLPLDASQPQSRLAYMLSDSRARYVLTLADSDVAKTLPEVVSPIFVNSFGEPVDIPSSGTANAERPQRSNPLAYVIYTSGSTGRPKGVAVRSRAVATHISAMVRELSLKKGDQILQVASYCFDTFIEQTFGGLAVGATIHFVERSLPDVEEFFAFTQRSGITVTDLPVGYFSQLLGSSTHTQWKASTLRKIVVGGEALGSHLVKNWFELGASENCELFNAYGPTEAIITSTLRRITEQDQYRVSIGRPVGPRCLYVVDGKGRRSPSGLPGELCIGGSLLAEGYLFNHALTQRVFVRDPFAVEEHAKMYRTGDLVRYLPDGTLEFIGRLDDQVQIRGFRVEPAEIEHEIVQVEGIDSAVVLPYGEPGNVYLVAYIKRNDSRELSEGEDKVYLRHLKMHLKAVLPGYMIPTTYVFVEKWPLLISGKIDRSSLPVPESLFDDEVSKPETEIEEALVGIWSGLLQVDKTRLGTTANFFEIGGHSLLVIRLQSEIKKCFDVHLDIQLIFDRCSIRELGQIVQNGIERARIATALDSMDQTQVEEVEF